MMHIGHKGPLGGILTVDDPLQDDCLASPDVVQATQLDRRRRGRPENVSPNLIPLLRNATSLEISPDDAPVTDRVRDDFGPAKGIIAGLLLAIPLWSLIALGVWWIVG